MDWLSSLTGKKDQQASSFGSYGAPSSSFGAPAAPAQTSSFGAPAAPASSSWWGGRRHKRHRQRGGVGNNMSANNNSNTNVNTNSNANSANVQKLVQQQMAQKGGFAHPYTMSNGVDRYATPIDGIRTASHMKQSGGRRKSRRVKGTRKKNRRGNKRTRKH